MEHMRTGDANISGSGSIAGGYYRDVKISGSGKIDGDIHALDVKVSGSAFFRGNVASESVKVSGSSNFGGHIDTGECKFSGSGEVKGHLHARSLSTSGSLSCKEGIRAEEVKISGSLATGGDVEAESFKSSGGFRIEGLLNASNIEVNMFGRSYVREIGGDRVDIGIAPLNVFWQFVVRVFHLIGIGSKLGLKSEVIEATDVKLEWTESRVVRGNRVWIGAGCNIDLVEYTESAYVDPDARVKEVRQIS